MIQNGVDPDTVKILLGHSTVLVTENYRNNSETKIAQAVSQLDALEKNADVDGVVQFPARKERGKKR